MTKAELIKLGKTTKEAKEAAEKAQTERSIAFTIDRVNAKVDEMVEYILRNVADVMSNGHTHLKFLVSDLRELDDAEKEVNDSRSLYHYVRIVENEHKDEPLAEIVEKMLGGRHSIIKAGGRLDRLDDYDRKDYFHLVAGIAQALALQELRRDGFSIEKVYWNHLMDDRPTEYDVRWDNVADDYSFSV